MPITVAQIYRYPVKGLSPEPLSRVDLARGLGLPQDRRFALAQGTTIFDPAAPAWMPKTKFLMLMKNERLARLRTRFDEASGVLTIEGEDRAPLRADLSDAAGRSAVENFFATYMGAEADGMPKLVEAPGHMFSDNPRKLVSIIGLASLRALESVVDRPVDPRRFRANLYLEGSAAWDEFDWVERPFTIGAVHLRGVKPIRRCAATNVDPVSAARDLEIPKTLQERFGHVHMGLYAEVLEGGAIARGDALTLSG